MEAGKKLEVSKRTIQRVAMEDLEFAVKFILHSDNEGTLSSGQRGGQNSSSCKLALTAPKIYVFILFFVPKADRDRIILSVAFI